MKLNNKVSTIKTKYLNSVLTFFSCNKQLTFQTYAQIRIIPLIPNPQTPKIRLVVDTNDQFYTKKLLSQNQSNRYVFLLNSQGTSSGINLNSASYSIKKLSLVFHSHQYFLQFEKYCHFVKPKNLSQTYLLEFFQLFFTQSTHSLPGHHLSVTLNIHPLGQLKFQGKTIHYIHQQTKWTVCQNKTNLERLPRLNDQVEVQLSQSKIFNQMARKFSLSLKKQQKQQSNLDKTLKKTQSLRDLLRNSQFNMDNAKNSLSQIASLDSKAVFKDKKKLLNENRILKLKSQTSQKNNSNLLTFKKTYNILKRSQTHQSLFHNSIRLQEKDYQLPVNKFKKSSSLSDIQKIAQSFKQRSLTSSFTPVFNQELLKSQSKQKVQTPNKKSRSKKQYSDTEKRHMGNQFSNKHAKILRNEFSKKINQNSKKLKIQSRKHSKTKGNVVLKSIKTEQSKLNAEYKRITFQRNTLHTQPYQNNFSADITSKNNEDCIILERNFHFSTMKNSSVKMEQKNIEQISKDENESSYSNKFLKRSISKPRLTIDQARPKIDPKLAKVDLIILQKSQNLMSKIRKEFPAQSAYISEMIEQFQTIWNSNYKNFIRVINKCQMEGSDFNSLCNQRISQKVQIQKYKILHLSDLTQLSTKSSLKVKKIVASIESEYNNKKRFLQEFSEQRQSPKISFRKFKQKNDNQRLRKAFDKIQTVQKRIKRLLPGEQRKMRWSLEKIIKKKKGNKDHKQYGNISRINLYQLHEEIESMLVQLRLVELSVEKQVLNDLVEQNNQMERVFGQVKSKQVFRNGPQISLRLRQFYKVLYEVMKLIGEAIMDNRSGSQNLEINISIQSFFTVTQTLDAQLKLIRNIFSNIQESIAKYYPPLNIQEWQKSSSNQIATNFQQIFTKSLQSEIFIEKQLFYTNKLQYIFNPKVYTSTNEMSTNLVPLDQIYSSMDLQENQLIQVNRVIIDITQAKLNLRQKIRLCLIDVQNNYQHRLKNLCLNIDKLLRIVIQIKPEMLFQQNYLEVKHKYLAKIQLIKQIFFFVLSRRLVYLQHWPKTLIELFKKILERRSKVNTFLENLDSRLKAYRSDMENEITEIQIIDKNLKQRLKQLSSKLRQLITEIRDERDILAKQKDVSSLNKEFHNYEKEKTQLIIRMQYNQIIYWDDDTFFERNVAALKSSLDFIKSETYKLIYQGLIPQIEWNIFLTFYNSYSQLMTSLEQTKLSKIFKPNYDLFHNNLHFIEMILYRNYSSDDIKNITSYQLKLGRDSHMKLLPAIKKITLMDKKLQDTLLNIFRSGKENQFHKFKTQTIISIQIQLRELTYFSQLLKQYKLYQISNQQSIYDQASVLCCDQSQAFLDNLQRFNKITHQLFYLKKTLVHLNAIQESQKHTIFLQHHLQYQKILSRLESQERINISTSQIYEIYQNIETQREKLSEQFYNEKVRFFPRLSLLDINSLVDCFCWKDHKNVLKNVQSLYNEIDEVICQKDSRKIKMLKVGHDQIEFEKYIDPESMNSIDFLKYLYASVQGLIEDSVAESFKRICHIKIITWYIYFTEQIECAFLLKNPISELKSRISLHIKEISSDIRYDVYQHHKKYEISQLNFFLDFLNKLQKNQDPEHSFLWANSIKVYQKNKKVIIKQHHHTYEFGYEPKKPEPFEPQFKIQRALKYGIQQHVELYQTSAKITGRPFLNLNLNKTTLKNKIYKILDIIYKYNFFVIIDHELLFQSEKYYFQTSQKNEKGKSFLQNNFKPTKNAISLPQEESHSNNNACSLINQLYKQLIYFSEYKQQSQGIQDVRLPILMKYRQISSIPTNFRIGYRTIDRPSRLFSLQLIVLIQLNKYQDFFSKFQVNLGRISTFFKLINEEFAMSFQKLIKILEDFDSFIKNLNKQNNQEDGKEQSFQMEDSILSQKSLTEALPIQTNGKNSVFKIKPRERSFSSDSIESVQSSDYDEADVLLNQNISNDSIDIAKPQKMVQNGQNQPQQKNLVEFVQINKMINRELFRILIHYYPDKEVEISKIIQYLTTESTQYQEKTNVIQEAIKNLKQGTKNVIIYGEMSEKTTQIKRFFRYGKNQLEVVRQDGKRQNIYIFYLEGLKNYLQIKETGLKFIVETQQIHEITPTLISENLVYVHPLSQKQLQEKFNKSLRKIFTAATYQQHLKQSFQNDIWTCFSDLHTVYIECEGILSLISKMDLFFNILEKELMVSQEERSKKKTDSKILLKQLITIMTELYIYSLDLVERKKFFIESKKKKYFQLNQLKGIKIEDLYNFTSINLETEKVQQLIKRQRFIFKNIFPIDRQIAMVKKYINLQKKYTEYLMKAQIHNQESSQKVLQLNNNRSLLKNFNFIFITQNHIINQILNSYFKEQFQDQFKHFKKYISNSKFLTKCLCDSPLNSSLQQNLNYTNKTLCVIEDLHLAIPEEQSLIKILIDHHTEFSKSKFYVFFINKFFVKQNTDQKSKRKIQYRPSLVFTIGEICLESIFKHLTKNNVHQNTIEKAKKLHTKGIFDDQVDYLKFILSTQVKLPSQLYQKYFLNSILLFNFTSNPSVEEFEYKYGSSNRQGGNLSLNQLRDKTNFWSRVNSSIKTMEEMVSTTYKYAVFMKKKSYLELSEADVQKYLDRFVQKFDQQKKTSGQCFFIELESKKSQHQMIQQKEQKQTKTKKNILADFIVKNHLKKYLHMSLNQQKVYIIEEQITLLPYLISFLYEQRLYTLSEENNFIQKFISIINSEIKVSKEKQPQTVVYQNFYILIKPPLALSQDFKQLLHLIIRKVSFLNFIPEFQTYLKSEKEKAEYVFNSVDLYRTKIKEFYYLVFNHCKFIVSVKQCHDELFSNTTINPQNICKQSSTKMREYQRNIKNKKNSKKLPFKGKKRLSQRQSLINRQLFQKNDKEFIKNYHLFYQNNVSSVDKLSKQFWQNIVYLNVTMREQQKVQISKYLLTKYFHEFNEQQDKNQDGLVRGKLRLSQDTQIQKVFKQLEELMVELLQKTLGYYNLSIKAIDQMIRETVRLLFSKKQNQDPYFQMKILNESVKIPSIVIQIKTQVLQTIQSFSQKAKSKEKIIQILTKQVKTYYEPLNQQQNSEINEETIVLAQQQTNQPFDYRSSLPFRKKKTQIFYNQNSKLIQQQKERFYSQPIQQLEEIFSSKIHSKNSSLEINHQDKVSVFYKALSESQSIMNPTEVEKLLKDSFTFSQGQLLPNKISPFLIRILSQLKSSLKKSEEQIQIKSEFKKRISIDNKTFEIEKFQQKTTFKESQHKNSKVKVRDSNQRISQITKINLQSSKHNKTRKIFQPEQIAKEEEQREQEHETIVQEKQNLMKHLFMSQNQFIESYPFPSIFDIVYQRYFNFMIELYEKYELNENRQNQNQRQNNLRIQKFQTQIKDAQYFLTIDLLTLQKKFLSKYQNQLQVANKQLEMLDRYISVCMKFNDQNLQKQHSKIISQQISQNQTQIPLEIKSHLYQTLFLNTLSNIKDNSALNDCIKKLLEIDNEPSLLSSIKKLSKNKINLSLSQQVQIKVLQEKQKFVISDPYHEFCHLIKNIESEIVFVSEQNFKQLNKIRFKIVFYVFNINSMKDFCNKKALIQKVQKLTQKKSIDSKSKSEKIVLLVSNKKILDRLNFSQNHYTALNLEFTYMKFREQINIKQQKLSIQQTESLFESYTNAYSRLFSLSKEISIFKVQDKQKVIKCLQKAENSIIKNFLNLSKEIEGIYTQKNKKNFEEGNCCIIYQYLNKLIEQDIIPYRYVKRINHKLDWPKLEELISTYSKTRRKKQTAMKNISGDIKEEIKQWLGKQLLALRSENFLDQLKECISVSNSIILVYDILHHKILKEIKMVSQTQKFQFKFYFEFDNLQRKDFLINNDEFGQVNFHEQTRKMKASKLQKELSRGSYSSYDNFERQTNNAFGRKSIVKKKKNDNFNELVQFSKKKKIFFVNENEIYKVKEVIHICSIIWV